MDKSVQLIAHRGIAYRVPENTLEALYRGFLEVGYVECDVHLSKDGCLVVLHGEHFSDMVQGHEGAVKETVFHEFPMILGPKNRGYKIPALLDLLRLMADYQAVTDVYDWQLNIELKGHGTGVVLAAMIDLFIKHNKLLVNQFLISSSYPDELIAFMKASTYSWNLACISSIKPGINRLQSAEAAMQVALSLKAEGVVLPYYQLRNCISQELQKKGLDIYIYNLDGEPIKTIMTCIDYGARYIFTDKVSTMKRLLQERIR